MQRACEMVQSLLKTQAAQQRTPYHPFCCQILQLMLKEGLIRGYTVEGNRITVLLKHYQGAPVIRNIRVVSKPTRDIWLLPHELKFRTRFNTGLWIMQTPVGNAGNVELSRDPAVVSHRDCIEMGIGGKVIFAVNNGFQHWC
ncbi:Ribosomal protein S8 [Durusdinium trenchii]|uniref:Mitochondrial n=1 Tax=Durusdinium trenchii TaxID=1381693 RepID=A0ABP0LPH9_9DINO